MNQDLTVPVITIDGGVATGKGTVAKLLAQLLKYNRLDSGVLYRAVGVLCDRNNITDLDGKICVAHTLNLRMDAEDRIFLNEENMTKMIRSSEGSTFAKNVAKIPEIRAALRERQYAMRKLPGLVTEGRDQGFIFETPHRYFLTVDAEVAATRRVEQLKEIGITTEYNEVLAGILERDQEDKERKSDPLRPHPGAVNIDTTHMSAVKVMQRILNHKEARRFGWL